MGLEDPVGEHAFVAVQLGRAPRGPWRVASRCSFGYPQVIVSPSLLDDGTRFPTYAWFTCPWLSREVSALESAGAIARYNQRVHLEQAFADELRVTDRSVRSMRRGESGGIDACETVGIAGQRDPLGVKCLHAHVALALVGCDDPIGREVLAGIGTMCDDEYCGRLVVPAEEGA